MSRHKLMINGQALGAEGITIFCIVGYETVALATNALTSKRVIPPITDMLGPLTHRRWGKLLVWMLVGWGYDHFYKKAERDIIERMRLAS